MLAGFKYLLVEIIAFLQQMPERSYLILDIAIFYKAQIEPQIRVSAALNGLHI